MKWLEQQKIKFRQQKVDAEIKQLNFPVYKKYMNHLFAGKGSPELNKKYVHDLYANREKVMKKYHKEHPNEQWLLK